MKDHSSDEKQYLLYEPLPEYFFTGDAEAQSAGWDMRLMDVFDAFGASQNMRLLRSLDVPLAQIHICEATEIRANREVVELWLSERGLKAGQFTQAELEKACFLFDLRHGEVVFEPTRPLNDLPSIQWFCLQVLGRPLIGIADLPEFVHMLRWSDWPGERTLDGLRDNPVAPGPLLIFLTENDLLAGWSKETTRC